MKGWRAFAASVALHALVLVGVATLVFGVNDRDAPVRVRVVASPIQPDLEASSGDAQWTAPVPVGSFEAPKASVSRPPDSSKGPVPASGIEPLNEGDSRPPSPGIEVADTEAEEAGVAPPLGDLSDRAPQPASDLRPPYPREARRRGWEGSVGLEVSVDAQGKAVGVALRSSSGHPILDRAAIEAVRGASFLPAVRAGVAKPATVVVTVRFRLE